MPIVSQSFQSAPAGRRVVMGTVTVGLITVGMAVANVVMAITGLRPPKYPGPAALNVVLSFLPLLVFIPVFLIARASMAGFRIEENVLVLGRKRFPLAGLKEAKRDPEVLCKTMKLWGNGGLGGISGTFKSRRLGKFYAFLTDTEHAVVLRLADKVVAVSPSDPDFFIHVVKEAAGIR